MDLVPYYQSCANCRHSIDGSAATCTYIDWVSWAAAVVTRCCYWEEAPEPDDTPKNCPHCGKPIDDVVIATVDYDRYSVRWENGQPFLCLSKNIDHDAYDSLIRCYECDQDIAEFLGDVEYE